jgi:hypothetical protein
MTIRKLLLAASFISTAALAGAIATTAQAGSAAVYVGYADGLRGGVDFPNPYGLGGTFTAGANTYTVTNVFGNVNDGGLDTGAIMILNTGGSNFVINHLDVSNVGQAAADFQIWTGMLGAGVTLTPGSAAIFTSTFNYDFDTSDFSGAALQAGFDPSFNNCSVGPISLTAACTGTAAIVTFTLDGIGAAFNDTGHVLDTGGYDSAGYNHIHTGGNGVPVFNTNEALGWRPIGTTGINNPSGTPEPATWAMMLLGFGGLGAVLRRRRTAALA